MLDFVVHLDHSHHKTDDLVYRWLGDADMVHWLVYYDDLEYREKLVKLDLVDDCHRRQSLTYRPPELVCLDSW